MNSVSVLPRQIVFARPAYRQTRRSVVTMAKVATWKGKVLAESDKTVVVEGNQVSSVGL
jgi:hypothetical protein